MRRLALLLLLGIAACSTSGSTAPSQRFVVFFQEWSAALDPSAQAAISAAAQFANQHPAQPVMVTGYADPDGSRQANVALSRTRAQVVVDQLKQDGVDPSRIRLSAHGPTDFTQAAVESRRVEIAVAGT
jgi:outer membrane protein OmpA-like peptidoglycan-associated protein